MPHILVDHDASLREALEPRRFAHALHALAAETVDGITVESCKTRFRCVDEAVIAHDEPQQSLVHVDFAILPGRSTDTKTRLAEAVLELVRAHTAAATDRTVHASVEVRDLDAAYVKHVRPAAAQ
ncbi:5-carboxymethyl-2-hydroxymuconate Delta-isomerase [Streptomyces noursei]